MLYDTLPQSSVELAWSTHPYTLLLHSTDRPVSAHNLLLLGKICIAPWVNLVANGYLSVHPLSFCTSSCGDLLSRHGATVNSRFQPLPNLSGVIHLLFFSPQFAPVWVRDFPSWFTLDKLIRRPQRDAYGDITYFAMLVLYCLVLLNSFPGTCTGGNWYWYHTLITRRFLAKFPLARWSGGFLQR